MQKYFDKFEKKENPKWWYSIVKGAIAVLISLAVMFLLMLVFSAIISGTGMPESSEGAVMVGVTAATALLMSALLTVMTNSRAILCALYSFLIITALKLLLTNAIVHAVTFTRQGIVGIIFTAVFCVIGALMGGNIRK